MTGQSSITYAFIVFHWNVIQCHDLHWNVLFTIGYLAVRWQWLIKSVGPSFQRWETRKPVYEAVIAISSDSQVIGSKRLQRM